MNQLHRSQPIIGELNNAARISILLLIPKIKLEMKGKQIMFFTTYEDVFLIMHKIETELNIKYFEMGLFDVSIPDIFNSISEINDFCKPKANNWNQDLRLIAIPHDIALNIRKGPQRAGGVKYAIDPSENQVSLCFQFGGIVREGVLLGGTCSSLYESEFCAKVYKLFTKKIKKEFKRIGAFYIGKEAEEKMQQGWRLVTNEKMPEEFDLRYE